MDDTMIDQMTGDSELRRRLEAYAELRLSPSLAASARIRARVLAVAHRQADLARADAALVVLPRTQDHVPAAGAGASRPRWRRAAPAFLAASLGLSLMAGVAMAVRPGGPLYDARLWAESVVLPPDSSARAIAALDRLQSRLEEAAAAAAAGDEAGVEAAMAAYARIVDASASEAILAGDAVAEAALETGMARNISVLQALVARVPAGAASAISVAIDAAIDRSNAAIDSMHDDQDAGAPDPGAQDGQGVDDGEGKPDPAGGAATATPAPTKSPKPEPTEDTSVAKPTKAPVATAEPTRTPRPTKSPPGGGKPPEGVQQDDQQDDQGGG